MLILVHQCIPLSSAEMAFQVASGLCQQLVYQGYREAVKTEFDNLEIVPSRTEIKEGFITDMYLFLSKMIPEH